MLFTGSPGRARSLLRQVSSGVAMRAAVLAECLGL
jgi:hypothetical protein